MRLTRLLQYSALLLTVLAAGAWTQTAPPKAQTATQFYLAYRAAFDKATKIEDLFPYVSADMRKKVEATPAADRPQGFEMMKMFAAMTNIKVTKEEITPTGAKLTATGVNADKKTVTGTIILVKEGGAWKLAQPENWPM